MVMNPLIAIPSAIPNTLPKLETFAYLIGDVFVVVLSKMKIEKPTSKQTGSTFDNRLEAGSQMKLR